MAGFMLIAVLSVGIIPVRASQCPVPIPPEPTVLRALDLPRTMSLADCEILGRGIADGDLRLIVPPPGSGVGVEALFTDGADEFGIETSTSGTVTLIGVGTDDQTGPGGGSAGGPPACDDPAYNLHGSYEPDTHH